MEIKHVEKEIRKYVVAVLSDGKAMYLYKKPGQPHYAFFKDIEKSTKHLTREDAIDTIKLYKSQLGDTQLDLVVIPLDVRYTLIEEINGVQNGDENENALIDALLDDLVADSTNPYGDYVF